MVFWAGLGIHDLGIASADELQQAETVAEGIAQSRDAAPVESLNRVLQRCSGGNGTVYRSLKIIDRKIEMDGSPVPPVGAKNVCLR